MDEAQKLRNIHHRTTTRDFIDRLNQLEFNVICYVPKSGVIVMKSSDLNYEQRDYIIQNLIPASVLVQFKISTKYTVIGSAFRNPTKLERLRQWLKL